MGLATTSVAPAGREATGPQGSPGLMPPSTRDSGGPLPYVHHTLHTARVQTHNPPVLRFPMCKTSRPLPFGNSALGTPYTTPPLAVNQAQGYVALMYHPTIEAVQRVLRGEEGSFFRVFPSSLAERCYLHEFFEECATWQAEDADIDGDTEAELWMMWEGGLSGAQQRASSCPPELSH